MWRRCLPAIALFAAGCGDDRAGAPAPVDAGRCTIVGRPATAPAAAPPPYVLGGAAYAGWADWPRLQLGVRAYLRSTYDRTGGNRGADASGFLYQRADQSLVPLDVEGPGELVFVRHNHWHGSPWHYRVDDRDTIVTESSTADPLHPVIDARFEPAAAFPWPVAITWASTRGADLSWVPIGFTRGLSLAYQRSHYGTGYFIFDRYPHGTTPAPWSATAPPPAAAAVLAPSTTIERVPADACAETGTIDVPADGAVVVADLPGATTIRALRFRVAAADGAALAAARLRITWDDRAAPSIDASLGLFFATGSMIDRDGDGRIVDSFPMTVSLGAEARFASYLPMPFWSRARVELVGAGAAIADVGWEIAAVPNPEPRNAAGYLHATYVDHGVPTPGADLVLLDTAVAEGGQPWCGAFIGTAFTFSDRAALWTLEGDPRMFFDDAHTPQGYGTGTEEWAGGGDYWGGQTMTMAMVGHPVGAPSVAAATSVEDQRQSAYRFLLADRMPFGARARIQLEHGPVDDAPEHYRTVSYWYGAPGACLVPADALDVGDLADELAHGYTSPTASAVTTLTSTWDAAGPGPTTTADGRTMTGTSEFQLALPPDNHGVLLRRTLDYAWPDQRATVAIDRGDGVWRDAGVWYLAGATTYVYSNPPGELDAPTPELVTSPHRLRDDEFLLGADLTAGVDHIRIRITSAPVVRPRRPGDPPGPRAWSELGYQAFAYVLPQL